MHTALHSLALLLNQAAATLPDTIYTKQVDTGIIQEIGVIASALMTLAVLLLSITLLLLVWYFRGIYRRLYRLIERVEVEVMPLMSGLTGLVGDGREIVGSVKREVRQVEGTIEDVQGRALDVVQRAEDRIRRFESLLDVIEEEAEETVVSVASAVRGVRTGLAGLFEHFVHGDGDDDGTDGYDGDTGYDGAPYGRAARPRARSQYDGEEYEDDIA